ncbi:hypothetical protein [Pseudomonas ovata]|uniref:hypothetical protein n=1 Tax=Pseudomonas ovata TaxID=1839709 RepID=UPI001F018133|nr:hypothetical protein [Pseudomonas ovata]
MPEFDPYPQRSPPAYGRWLLMGGTPAVLAGVLALWGGTAGEIRRVAIYAGAFWLLLWLAAFLLRILACCLSRYNAWHYDESTQRICAHWWAQHRQTVSLLDTVLLGPACSTPEQRQALFQPDHKPPAAIDVAGESRLALAQILAGDVAERERQLAHRLVAQWCEQHDPPPGLVPLRCYWQGTPQAWQAFFEQMSRSCPQIVLPAQPQPWQGIDSLASIIDQLQEAPGEARILCAGCQSSSARQGSNLLPGEAAVLWVLGRQGDVRLTRGEWYVAEAEALADVAGRVLQQSERDAPTDTCVAFSDACLPDLATAGWSPRAQVQDANFGDLAGLQAMVAITLAASHCQHSPAPCAWLARDPHYALALGIVHPHD